MILFYAVHYPKSEYEEQLLENMHKFGSLMKEQPGCIWINPYPFKNPEKGR